MLVDRQKISIIAAFVFLGLFAFQYFVSAREHQTVLIGVNLVNSPDKQTPEELEATLSAMNKAGVNIIRCGITDTDAGQEFVQRVHDHGIRMLWLTGPSPEKGTPWPQSPKGSKVSCRGYALSKADPDLSRDRFQRILDLIEAKNIELAGIEVGNEFNWVGFNADFSLPGRGKVLNAADLAQDAEGIQIARGFVQYIKVLVAIKEIRNHSKLNQHTPIITGGLADCDGAENWLKQVKADEVSTTATLQFLRAHGVDNLVDGYGIHCYPHLSHGAGSADAQQSVREHIDLNGLLECEPSGSAKGKPCWITEWGVDNVDEKNRSLQAEDIRKYCKQLAHQGRLQAMFFYNWQGDIHSAKEDGASAYRSGGLSDAGRIALSPL